MFDKFPAKSKGDSLAADHVNALGEAVARECGANPGQNAVHFRGAFHASIDTPEHIEVYAKVTSLVAFEYDTQDSEFYGITLRYRNTDTGLWEEEEDSVEHLLDVSGFVNEFLQFESQYLVPHDVIGVRYDRQRNMFVPVNMPGLRKVVASQNIGLDEYGLAYQYGNAGRLEPDRFIRVYNNEAYNEFEIFAGDELYIDFDHSLGHYVVVRRTRYCDEISFTIEGLADDIALVFVDTVSEKGGKVYGLQPGGKVFVQDDLGCTLSDLTTEEAVDMKGMAKLVRRFNKTTGEPEGLPFYMVSSLCC